LVRRAWGTLELDVVAGRLAFTSAEDVVAYVRACICICICICSCGSGA
jgi:hypothetical protein